jgi:hypothetical protein
MVSIPLNDTGVINVLQYFANTAISTARIANTRWLVANRIDGAKAPDRVWPQVV